MTDYTLQIIMDSFYDMPRCAPAPTPVDKFFAAPAVPEVSLFCPGNGQTNYNAWRVHHHHHTQNGHYAASSQVNISKNLNMRGVESSVILKKQVRFEGPISHHHPIASSSLSTILKEKSGKENKKPNEFVDQKPLPSANTFEQIYMANIPSRQLDLSIVDLPRNDSKKVQSNSLPHEGVKCRQVCVEDKHRENLSICEDKCESVTDDFNKNDRLPKTYQEFLEKQKKVLENASLCDDKCESQKDIRKNDKLPKTYQEFSEKQRKGLKNKKILGDNCVTDLYNYKRSPIKVPSPIREKNYNSRCPSFTHAGRTKPFGNPSPDNNQQLLNESHSVRNIQNTQASNFDFNHRVCESEHQIPSQHKCAYGMQNMCNEDQNKDAKGCIAGTAKNVEESQQISPALSNEPTTTDLLKIIAQQNEQLLLLQKQVAVLLSRENTTQNRPQVMGEKIMSSTQTEHFQQQMYTPKKRGLSKFSIDMMTSFEVAIRPSQHNKNQFPKIQEITETESASEPIEPSLRLEEPVNIPENCPSPEPTVNIEMQDYDSSDEDCASEIGATFYKNLMGQVNNILKKAQLKAKENVIDGKKLSGRSDKTMHRIKEATLKHLKNIGITVDDDGDSSNNTSFSSDSSNCSPSEVSFAVKQLLMKYLPDDELAKMAQMKKPTNKQVQDKNNVGCNVPPQFSIASIEYLRKYNIIPKSDKTEAAEAAPNVKANRILDLTALKKQPKLL